MIEVTIEELQKKFESLPEDLRWAIMSANVDENITEIGKDLGLNVAQMGQLSLETHAVMFGFTPLDKFEESVKASLVLPDEKIKAIINAVNEKVLKNIREQLMALQGVKKEDENKKDVDILKSAQIEITDGKTNTQNESPTPATSSREDILSKVENPSLINKEADAQKIQSIAAKKLSGSFNIPTQNTNYTLNNLSKQSTSVNQNPVNIPPTTSMPKVDPYREIPE